MRITKRQLRQIIKEELVQTLEEAWYDSLATGVKAGVDAGKKLGQAVKGAFSGGKSRTAEEIQADIDATNADMAAGNITQQQAIKLLGGYTREQKKAGHDPHKSGEALTGLAGVDASTVADSN